MKTLYICLLGAALSASLFSQETPAGNYWTAGTAYNLPAHRWEAGIFTRSTYGLTPRVELSAHPLMVFLLPEIRVKVGWGDFSGLRLASEHGILYPSMFMKLVAMKGTGGFISPELTIPQMAAISNRILVSLRPGPKTILSAHAGVSFSLHSEKPDIRGTIDLPIFYPRFAVFYSQPEFDAGIGFRGNFSAVFGWDFTIENFICSGTVNSYFMENKGVLVYTSKKQRLRAEAGYKLCFGQYPDGDRWHLLPDINLVFGIGK
jgi:hypothetical protein